MSRRRRTPEQVVRKLREADRLLGDGKELPEVWKQLTGDTRQYCTLTKREWRRNSSA